MRYLVRDVSRVLTLFLASRQAWPKILGGEVSMFGGELPPPKKGAWITHWLFNIYVLIFETVLIELRLVTDGWTDRQTDASGPRRVPR